MSSIRMTIDQMLRRGRVQARRVARQAGFQRRSVASSFAAPVSAGPKRMSLLDWYSAQLDARPLFTKCVTGGIIAGLGDVLCQVIVADDEKQTEKKEEDAIIKSSSPLPSWDVWRTARFAFLGSVWVAPGVHCWYGFLTSRLLPGAATPMRIAQRVAADQFGFGPAFGTGFMCLLWLLEGRWQEDASGTLNTLADTMPGVLATGLKVWIPAITVNFAFVPLKYQVLYSNVVSLFWNAYLSYVSAAGLTASAKDETATPALSAPAVVLLPRGTSSLSEVVPTIGGTASVAAQ